MKRLGGLAIPAKMPPVKGSAFNACKKEKASTSAWEDLEER